MADTRNRPPNSPSLSKFERRGTGTDGKPRGQFGPRAGVFGGQIQAVSVAATVAPPRA